MLSTNVELLFSLSVLVHQLPKAASLTARETQRRSACCSAFELGKCNLTKKMLLEIWLSPRKRRCLKRDMVLAAPSTEGTTVQPFIWRVRAASNGFTTAVLGRAQRGLCNAARCDGSVCALEFAMF